MKRLIQLVATSVTAACMAILFAAHAQAALMFDIYDNGAKVSISTAGGTLDLTGETLSNGGSWSNPVLWRGARIGATDANTSLVLQDGDVSTAGGWTSINLFLGSLNVTWAGDSFLMVLVNRGAIGGGDDDLYFNDDFIAGLNSISAGTATTVVDTDVASLGFTEGSSITFTTPVSRDTVTFNIARSGAPVPAPATLALFGLGLLGLRLRRRD